MRVLLILLIMIPLVEIYFLIQVGDQIGAGWTIIAVLSTAIIGLNFIRQQGFKTVQKIQQRIQAREAPAQEGFDGLCLCIAGVFLMIPGFVTDAIGFLLLVPPIRTLIYSKLSRFQPSVQVHSVYVDPRSNPHETKDNPRIIDVEVEEKD